MSIIGSTEFLERTQFFNGERLFASDLQSLESFNREMRWLHNQSLHQAGVGSGFQVVGNTGDRQVTISPGYALDSCGREIVLTGDAGAPYSTGRRQRFWRACVLRPDGLLSRRQPAHAL